MSKNHEVIWGNCLQIIKDNVQTITFKTWFEPIVPLKIENKVLTIQVPSLFFYEYLEEHYIDLLRKTLCKELGADTKLEYNVVMENNPYFSKQPYTVKMPGSANIKKELKNKPVSIPLNVDDNPGIKNPFIIPGLKKLTVDPQLNPEYSFANFIEGECNRLARSAGYAVANSPGGTAFNPLFLFGASGLGKSHLAQAIGIEVKERYPDKVVLYVNGNKFHTQFVEAILNNNRNDFLHFYQMIDVLIIDDVHEFAGKTGTQNAFFHIFSHLHSVGKQLILTSDKAPVDLQDLEMRLLSRFKWGLLAELLPPDYNTRVEILKAKSYKDGITLPEEVTNYIASRVSTNIREIEGTLISLLAQSTLTNRKINLDLAESLIEKLVTKNKPEISVDRIQKIVCEYFRIDPQQFLSASRKRELVQARQISMYLSRNLTKSSLASIGTQTGGRDHATVLHAYNTVCDLLDTDRSFRKYVVDIEKQLKSN